MPRIIPELTRADYNAIEWRQLPHPIKAQIIAREPAFADYLALNYSRLWRGFDADADRPLRVLCRICHIDTIDIMEHSFVAERAFVALETSYEQWRAA